MPWVGEPCSLELGGGQNRRAFHQALRETAYFEEKLLLLMLDLLFHLLIEMLDFFIISSNFPAEVAEGESDEVYTQFPLSHSVSPGARTPGPRQEPGVVGGW